MPETTGWIEANIPDQGGKLFLVTGANSGLGYELARGLAQKKAAVVMACRGPEKGEGAAAAIRQEYPGADLRVMQLDLADLRSVRDFAGRFHDDYGRLDVLVNNAGVMATPFGKTADGFELQFGTNHLGHFALTGLLLDVLQPAPGSRVVTVSSYAHWFGFINFADLNAKRFYYRWMAYTQSKLANLLFAYELQRRLAKNGSATISLAAHPGSTVTQLQQYTRLFTFINGLIGQSPAMSALPILYAATRPGVAGGDYIGPSGFLGQRGYPHKALSSPAARSDKTARRLWEVSEELTGVRYGL